MIGFTPNRVARRAGSADMSAGGPLGHRLALNAWRSKGASQPPAGTAGMRYSTLAYRSQDGPAAAVSRFQATRSPVEVRGQDILVHDPSGSAMLLTVEAWAA